MRKKLDVSNAVLTRCLFVLVGFSFVTFLIFLLIFCLLCSILIVLSFQTSFKNNDKRKFIRVYFQNPKRKQTLVPWLRASSRRTWWCERTCWAARRRRRDRRARIARQARPTEAWDRGGRRAAETPEKTSFGQRSKTENKKELKKSYKSNAN